MLWKFLKKLEFKDYIVALLLVGAFFLVITNIFYWEPQGKLYINQQEKEACSVFCKNNNTSIKTYNNKICFCKDHTEGLPCYRFSIRSFHNMGSAKTVHYYMINKETINKMDNLR